MTHYEQCEASVSRYAYGLKLRVEAKRNPLNRSACDGLIESYLDQPAFPPEWRDKLRDGALALIDGRRA